MTKYKDTKEGQFIYKQVKKIRIEGILCISLGLIYLLFNILENYVDVPITLIDERLSTVEAESILLANDMSRKKRKNVIDVTAAMIILDTYLKKEKNNEK